MLTGTWPNSASGPTRGSEYVLSFDQSRDRRVLVVPALFDEGNKLRHSTVETMRLLDFAGVDSALADLPGTNESLQSLEPQTLAGWRDTLAAFAREWKATHLLAIRGGALCLPEKPPAFAYAPVSGSTLLRGLLRARVIADREGGQDSDREALLDAGRDKGLELAGYRIGSAMLRALESADPAPAAQGIAQAAVGGAGLWLRAEPAHDAAQAAALAQAVLERLG